VPPGAEAGRLKTEQYVQEFLYKVTELVLQSRVHLPADTTRSQSSSARRGWVRLWHDVGACAWTLSELIRGDYAIGLCSSTSPSKRSNTFAIRSAPGETMSTFP
jgi:hypothetical protein